MRILLVEDDADLSRQLKMALADAGYAVDHAPDGEEAQFLGETEPYDAVILDLGLPKVDGVSVLERWRRENMATPVLILTARGAWSEKVAGFDAGADDYLTKPFHTEELLARLRALLRRSGMTVARTPAVVVGDLILDEDSREVCRDGDIVELTATEFELLRYLMRNPRRVLSKAQILDQVWHYDFGGNSNVVELYISYLRKKVDAGRSPMIHTMRGAGYVLKPAAD
jgi:two-component system OmpR family response regulator